MGSESPLLPDWLPSTKEQRSAVLRQLERILDSPGFRASKKYPALLRGVVELTLEGKLDLLKERSLGVTVFKRPPDYDTSVDPVVRVVAAEVRKKIAQYYHEASSANEIIIDLPPGSYHARFRLPHGETVPAEEPPAGGAIPAQAPTDLPPSPTRPEPQRYVTALRGRLRLWHALAAVLAVAVVVVALLWIDSSRGTAMDRFWRPLIDQERPVLILLGGALRQFPDATAGGGATPVETGPLTIGEYQIHDSLTLGEATALSRVSTALGRYDKSYSIQRARSIDLTLLRNGPVIVIGGFNNSWTRRLTAGLRYTLARDRASQETWIEDAKNKGMHEWRAVDSIPFQSATDDFAIVARLRNSTTEHPVLIAAGLKVWGTLAAGEFVANPAYLEALEKKAPRGWGKLNLEVVIRTRVINGVSGPPQLLAVEFW
jgi:hypothetical protein